MGTLGYMSPEQVEGQGRRINAPTSSRSARSSTRCSRASARSTGFGGGDDVGDLREEPADLVGDTRTSSRGSSGSSATAWRRAGGAVPLGSRPRVRPAGALRHHGQRRRLCELRTSLAFSPAAAVVALLALRRPGRGCFLGKSRAFGSPTFSSHLPPRGDLSALRFGREVESCDGGVAAESARRSHQRPEPRGGHLRGPGRRNIAAVASTGEVAVISGGFRHRLHAGRNARPRRRDGGAPASCSRRSSTPTGHPTARTSR